MTQEKDSAALSGEAAPAKDPAQTGKKRATARKAPAKKAPAGKIAVDAPEDAVAPKKTAVSKPRAAARTKAAAKPAPETGPKAAADAAPVAEPAKDTAKPARAKAPAKPRAARSGAASAQVPAAGEKAAEKTDGAASAPAQASAQAFVEDAPKPAPSRRSRRGGRRRNKSRAAVAEQAAAPAATAGIEPEAGPEENPAPKSEPRGNENGKAPSGQAKTTQAEAEKPASGKRRMFISVLSGELVEVVLAEGDHVVEYYVEMQHQAKVKGNIYKGVVSNIDANLQAAFVSYASGVKNGFLQIDEVHPEYYQAHHDPNKGRKYPPIQKVLKPGQEILVQVAKEPAGTKGAFLTSYLSLPGRFLVLTPGREQIGVSRKVDNDEERSRLRTLLEGLTPGKGLGVIVRTASSGATKTNLQRDLQFLKRLWKEVRGRGQNSPVPSLIYEELDLSARAVRDYLTDDVREVWVDDAATARQITELTALLFPRKQNLVQTHSDAGHSLFERFSLQKQLDQIHSREVALPSGGRLVIDNTEALTAIDINSGRSGGKSNFEDMAFRTNMEAAKAIPLHLRLRDIGGQVVADFIEMRDRDHWREVEKVVRAGMKGDRARYDVGKIGPFGMLEIVRQRLGSSAISISTEPCPCCKGTGIRRNMEWQAMQALRDVSRMLRQAAANNQPSLTFHAEPDLAFYLLNAKRAILQSMEEEAGVALAVRPSGPASGA